MATIKTIYAVNQGDDDRHCGTPCWFFELISDANQCAAGRGWYGGNAPVSKHLALIVDGDAYLLARAEPVKLNETPDDQIAAIAAAKAKLTPEDLKILGLG